jgi:NADPH-dependent 2,4-dienoyl-CoA reductase/sulfur reductase-like enzyme
MAASPRVVVVGAGPAGIRAAQTLARAGLRPVLVDEAMRPGGQIYRQPPAGAGEGTYAVYGFEAAKARAVHAAVAAMGAQVDYRPQTLVWNLFGNALDLLGPDGPSRVGFERIVLATGAMDRAIPFAGWTLPGVFTLGAAQIALKAQGVAIGRRVALVGAGPLLPLVTHQYLKAGVDVAAALDVTPLSAKFADVAGLLALPRTLAKGLYYTARCGTRLRYGVRSLKAIGGARVEALEWVDAKGRTFRVACDAVGASFGLRSESQLADLAGCRFVYDALARQWIPEKGRDGRSSAAHVYLAGDGAGIGGADAAELQGERAALSLLADCGLPADTARDARFRAAIERAYPFPSHLVDAVADDEMVCRCEGITAGTLREAATAREAGEVNRLKAFTRIGMGRCQGRVCGIAAAELLSRARGVPVELAGRLRGQAPVKPVPIGALAR